MPVPIPKLSCKVGEKNLLMVLFDDVHISLVPPGVSLEAGGGTLVVELRTRGIFT